MADQTTNEPVAWMNPSEEWTGMSPVTTYYVKGWTPLYAAPPDLAAALAAERAEVARTAESAESLRLRAENAEAALAAAGTDRQVWYDIGVEKAARWIEAQYSSCVWEKHLVAGIRSLKRAGGPVGQTEDKPEHHKG